MAIRPTTVRSECTKVSSGIATKTSAKGSTKPMPICAAVVIHIWPLSIVSVASPRSRALVASSSLSSSSRM